MDVIEWKMVTESSCGIFCWIVVMFVSTSSNQLLSLTYSLLQQREKEIRCEGILSLTSDQNSAASQTCQVKKNNSLLSKFVFSSLCLEVKSSLNSAGKT